MKSRRAPAQIVALIAKWFVLIFFLAMTFVPLIWLVISSFKTDLELLSDPFKLPKVWKISNYGKAIRIAELHRLFLNSIIVAAGATGLNIVVASMAGFVLSRERFRSRNLITTMILAGVLVPVIGLMVPYFKLVQQLGLYDTLIGLILTYSAINIPISVFLLRGYMSSIPKELEEAVIIDGCNFFQRFSRIIFPLSKLGIVTAGTFVFLYSWNEFIYALLLTSSVGARTVQLGIRFFRSQFITHYTAMYAAIVITMIPTIIVYIALHERIIKGLTSGAVKG